MSKAARLVGAELVGDRGGDGRGLQHVRDGRDDRRSRSAPASMPAPREGLARTAATAIICDGLLGLGPAPLP